MLLLFSCVLSFMFFFHDFSEIECCLIAHSLALLLMAAEHIILHLRIFLIIYKVSVTFLHHPGIIRINCLLIFTSVAEKAYSVTSGEIIKMKFLKFHPPFPVHNRHI